MSKDYCPSCYQNTNHRSLFKEHIGSKNYEDFHWSEDYEVIRCEGCENIQYRTTYSDESMTAYHPDGDYEVDYSDYKYYPKNLKGHKILKNIYHIPDKIRIVYIETIEAMKNNCYLLSAVGLRAIIEAICIEQNITGRNLELKINNLSKNKLITEKDSNRLHTIRFLGNDSVHEMEVPKEDKLNIALKIVESLIDNLYLIDIDANILLDTIITDYEMFRNLFVRKFIPIAQNEEKSIKELLGKDYRRIETSYIANFTQQIMDEINNNIIGNISVGIIKNSTVENSLVQHFYKN
jgi:hypothetical protein